MPLVAAVLALLSLAANNDLSGLQAGAPPAATLSPDPSGAGPDSPAVTVDGVTGTATTLAEAPGTGTMGAGGSGDGAGSGPASTTASAALTPDPDGAEPARAPGSTIGAEVTPGSAAPGTTLAPGTTRPGAGLTTVPGTTALPVSDAGNRSTFGTQLAPGSSVVPGSVTAAPGAGSGAAQDSTAGQEAAIAGAGTGDRTADTTGDPTATTTAVVSTAGADGGGDGLASTVRTVLTALALGLTGAGAAYLAGSMLKAILNFRRRGDADDDLDHGLGPLDAIIIDPSVAGWTLERLRAELESEPDPRQAVRKAYAVVESGFGAGGSLARRRTETPLQYIERTLGVVDGATQPLRVLTGLFLLARFSNRPMNDVMRRAAIDAVIALQTHYRQAERQAA